MTELTGSCALEMATPRTAIWDIEPHTRAKHEILKLYLQAWMPILTHGGFPKVMYVDGFAGPGRYSNGENGSPIIALHVAMDQFDRIRTSIHFVFIEKDKKRADMLKEVVRNIDAPKKFQIEVKDKSFEAAFREILDSYQHHGDSLPPTFAFIDPFGWKAVPFSIIQEIMEYPNCEVFVTFMYEEINRFLKNPDQKDNFDAFFGTPHWRKGVHLKGTENRKRFLHDLYLQQLKEVACASYVRSFEMRNERDVVDYYLFHATNSIVGLKKMKEAMWKVDETGEFIFSDATDFDQLVLFERKPSFEKLQEQLLTQFRGREATIKEIENFVLENTAFRETHYKRQVLKPLERASMIEAINPRPERKFGTYKDNSLRLRFKEGVHNK